MPDSQRPRGRRPRTGRQDSGVRSKRVVSARRARGAGASSGQRRRRLAPARFGNRFSVAMLALVFVLSAAGVKLVYLQAFQAEAYSEQAERQRSTMIDIPAERGSIVDREGNDLAFSVETRTLQVNLKAMRAEWDKVAKNKPQSGQNFQTRSAEIAAYMAEKLPDKTSEEDLRQRFAKAAPFTFLVDGVEPSTAEEITGRYPEIAQEKRAYREYPAGRLASNVVGYANWRMDDPDRSKHNIHGLIGLENARDNELAGQPGRRIVETGEGDDIPIPGTERDLSPAVAGSDLRLTLDSDTQHELQTRLQEYVRKSKAFGGSAVIMDAETGEVHALADDKSFDPSDLNSASDAEMNNRAVTTPFEPGSVNKLVTAAAAIENGVTQPDATMSVPGQIRVADRTVKDAWDHGTQNFTTTGIFAKSSNVGTIKLAREIGEDAWVATARKFGIGERTGIGLPGESPGRIPPKDQWSGSTFGNLPIGQGLSMTVVQMTSMYQAIANDGVRVPPRIAKETIHPDGTREPEEKPKTTRVVSAETADSVLQMLRATTQDGEGSESGTAPAAAVEGYQISGKTGTAQQVDPDTGKYSQSDYNITFAGILPADDPKFVVGLMLDAPDNTSEHGSSAAPLFHDIAAYLAQRYDIPLSESKAPQMRLIEG